MLIVETFNNGPAAMGTMNFSIPDDVKDAFKLATQVEQANTVETKSNVSY